MAAEVKHPGQRQADVKHYIVAGKQNHAQNYKNKARRRAAGAKPDPYAKFPARPLRFQYSHSAFLSPDSFEGPSPKSMKHDKTYPMRIGGEGFKLYAEYVNIKFAQNISHTA